METAWRTILYREANGVAWLTLNRPERLNSFTTEMHAEVREALARVATQRETGTVRALVLTGAGRGFCAGQDLNDRAVAPGEAAPDLGESIEKNYKPLILTLRQLELPVIAAVNGVAAGAGANLALACDLVFAARSARFIQSFAKLGLVPDTGGSWTLPRLVGPARALGLALLGENLSAEAAEQWGLIWQCVDDDALIPTVTAVAEQLAAGPTYGYAQTKKLIWSSFEYALTQQLDRERDAMRACGQTHDYQEGVRAFLEKRPPRYLGR
ncbi:MAG: 2-(1,2-epoxy-1,2-dihydrophenyl)acetyl-CoA isomerase PaaG [Hydrogenophilus thermoluteolus]|uniref:2-(1,2-epoxy-1,2-dihydrophenyl)acetyl-CoA isomerase PaaG n=1 Tax=Hydrogenophilus thermoluteolus TaxID=297 RepID=UPI001C641994|nr:2-(1,2-epoxy-1,2-dihydrophenyl)acetyl-CoA isomerase PaaG [Hydrogenophilus thermoluteolus]MBW7656420.1 2-(1,2-epoxy-1,2-dihydrophenyl)acetyl-CoA isomerase PaaG [Hydrogenophilus thermoluteolus]